MFTRWHAGAAVALLLTQGLILYWYIFPNKSARADQLQASIEYLIENSNLLPIHEDYGGLRRSTIIGSIWDKISLDHLSANEASRVAKSVAAELDRETELCRDSVLQQRLSEFDIPATQTDRVSKCDGWGFWKPDERAAAVSAGLKIRFDEPCSYTSIGETHAAENAEPMTFLTVVASAREAEMAKRHIAASPFLCEKRRASKHNFVVLENYPRVMVNPAGLINQAIRNAVTRLVVIVKYDIYLPGSFIAELMDRITRLDREQPFWSAISFVAGPDGRLVVETDIEGARKIVAQRSSFNSTRDGPMDEAILVLRSAGSRNQFQPVVLDHFAPTANLAVAMVAIDAHLRGLHEMVRLSNIWYTRRIAHANYPAPRVVENAVEGDLYFACKYTDNAVMLSERFLGRRIESVPRRQCQAFIGSGILPDNLKES